MTGKRRSITKRNAKVGDVYIGPTKREYERLDARKNKGKKWRPL